MTQRQKILGRIREALSITAPLPQRNEIPGSNDALLFSSQQARQWLPAIGDSFEDKLAAFRHNALKLKADFVVASHREDLAVGLRKLRDDENWKRIATHSGELSDFASGILGLPILSTDRGYDVHELETCVVGITECDALVAQTGSVLITSRSAGGRALSALPPHHIVLARREQLLRDLPAAFALLKQNYGADYPSMISFITGPSRTGDIERTLVLGAHGPKKLTIFLV